MVAIRDTSLETIEVIDEIEPRMCTLHLLYRRLAFHCVQSAYEGTFAGRSTTYIVLDSIEPPPGERSERAVTIMRGSGFAVTDLGDGTCVLVNVWRLSKARWMTPAHMLQSMCASMPVVFESVNRLARQCKFLDTPRTRKRTRNNQSNIVAPAMPAVDDP